MSIRVVIADDHPLILDALEGLFKLEEDIEVVARCTDGAQTVETLMKHEADILLLDLKMPVVDGLAVMRQLSEQGSPVRVIVLAAVVTDREMMECLRLGARGVILKEAAPHLLIRCVRKVYAGDLWVEKQSMSRVVDLMLQREAGTRRINAELTPREVEIVRMAATGLRNKEIAERLSVTEGTVKVHLHNIYAKLQVDGRVALMRYAQDVGLV